MEYRFLLRRRTYSEGDEPLINYVYRLVGFLSMVILFLGSLTSLVLTTTFPLLFTISLRGAVFCMVVFFTGLIASEVWAYAISRKWYTPVSSPFSQEHLVLSILGFFAGAVILIFLTLTP